MIYRRTRNTWRDILTSVTVGLALWSLAIGASLWAILQFTPPEVHVDSVTGECVRVVPADAGTCENLPEKYTRVPVAPAWMRGGD